MILGGEGFCGFSPSFLGVGREKEGKICWHFYKDVRDEVWLSESKGRDAWQWGRGVIQGVGFPAAGEQILNLSLKRRLNFRRRK